MQRPDCTSLAALVLLGFGLTCGQTTGGGVRPIDSQPNERCEVMTVDYCQDVRVTKSVYLPNARGHDNQTQALKEFDDYLELITESACSNGLYHFLCSYYFPLCYTIAQDDRPIRVKPCRSLCEYVRAPCEAVLESNDIMWPAFLNCSLDDFDDGDTCFGPADPSTARFTTVGVGGAIITTAATAGGGTSAAAALHLSVSLLLAVFGQMIITACMTQ